jgi:nucleotide-binding universal stress UspA family protein
MPDAPSGPIMVSMAGIVVGVDGSPESQRALIFAVTEARVRGEGLRAIAVWHREPWRRADREAGDDADRVAEAQAAVQSALDLVLAGTPVPSTELMVCEGDAARVLIEESRDAALLVVGSRGRGRLRAALLGSVSRDCASHAHCPVAVIR